jgi:hypothetical protein
MAEIVKKTSTLSSAWGTTAKMHNTRWTPDEFVEELCVLAKYRLRKRKMVALVKEFIDVCVEYRYMKKINLLLLGLAKKLKDLNLLAEILVYCGDLRLRDVLKFRMDSFVDTFNNRNVGKKILAQVYTLDHLWFNLYGNSLKRIRGCAVHPNSIINREKVLRYINENWPTSARSSYQTFFDRFPQISDNRQLIRFLYCKYYCNRVRPKSIIIFFSMESCIHKKLCGFNYRLTSKCGKYVIYQRSRLKKNSYFELHHNNQVSILTKEDLQCLEQ